MEAAEAKAKNAMFEPMPKEKMDDTVKAAGLAQDNNCAEERSVQQRRVWARDDEIRCRHSGEQSERLRKMLALDAICQSNNQPFSAAKAATGSMLVARTPDAATCTSATNNEPVPMAPATSPRAPSGPPRLYAVPVPLAIMDVVPEVPLTD